jgi:hypothetical protein
MLLLTNGIVEVRVPRSYGPRVTEYHFAGEPNVFGDGAGASRPTPDGLWRAFGGHRLWAAPERFPETYTIDDRPPEIERRGERSVVVHRRRDERTGLRVSIGLDLAATGTEVSVDHRIRNDGTTAQHVGAWGITIVCPGGCALIPNAIRRSQREALLPARTMTLWHYTDLGDPRLTFGARFVRVRCDPERPSPNKLGFACEKGWVAYLLDGVAFVVRAPYQAERAYPDLNSSVEIYTEGSLCEVETLGPLDLLQPGDELSHQVLWSLARVDADDDETLAQALEEHLRPRPAPSR